MKRVSLSGAVLALALLSTGCPDGRVSKDPAVTAQIEDLKGDIAGLQVRVTAVEGADKQAVKDLESRLNRLERGLKPVTVNVTLSGKGIETSGPVEVKQGGTSTSGGNGNTTDPGGNTPDAGEDPKPNGSKPDGRDTKIGQRFGFDAWNEINPRKPGEKPRKGGRIRVRFTAQPDLLNTHLDNSAVTSYITAYVNETLLGQNARTYAWEPMLAESWTTEDTLFEIKGAEPLAGVEWSASSQKWIKKQDEQVSTWFPWEVRKTAAGHELLQLTRHIGTTEATADGWVLTTKEGKKTFAKNVVAGVNKGTVFTFKIKKNATFHDGRPVTAEDVQFSLNIVKCKYVDAPSIRTYYQDVEPAEILDGHTVRVVYRKQYFKAIAFAGGIVVYPKHIFDPDDLLKNAPEKFGEYFDKHPRHREPIGSGPYKFKAWDQGRSVTLTRYDGYHTPEKGGYLDELTWRFLPEDQAALAELRAGNIDFVPVLKPEQFFKETSDAAFTTKWVKPKYYTGGFGYVGWNMRTALFKDVRVRRALAHGALDIQKYIRTVLYGAGTQVAGSQYYYGPAYDRSAKPYEYNPAKAERLLREAGWFDRDGNGVIENANGLEFDFELLMPQGATAAFAQIMLDNLRKLGIKVRVRTMEWAIFIKDINKRNFEACRLGWGQSLESDPFQIWHSSGSENEGSNHCGFVSPEADQLILQIRQELDDEKRYKLQAKFQKILYETQPYLFLYCSPNLGAYDPKYHGVQLSPLRPGYDLLTWYDSSIQGE